MSNNIQVNYHITGISTFFTGTMQVDYTLANSYSGYAKTYTSYIPDAVLTRGITTGMSTATKQLYVGSNFELESLSQFESFVGEVQGYLSSSLLLSLSSGFQNTIFIGLGTTSPSFGSTNIY